MFAEVQTRPGEARLGFQHAVAGFLGAAGFRNHHDQGVIEILADFPEDPVEAVGIGVVEEINRHQIARRPERIRDELRPERGAADPDQENALEWLAARRRDAAHVNVGGELLYSLPRVGDLAAQLVVRRELRIAQPVMADHALFVGVGDGAGLQLAHGGESSLDLRLHLFEKAIRKPHPADVDRKAEVVVAQVILLKTLPERLRSHEVKLIDNQFAGQAAAGGRLEFRFP